MNAPTKSNRPWRVIAVVVVLLLAVTVWLAAVPLYQRHVAIQEIERLEGSIDYESISPDWLVDSGMDGWLRRVGIKLDRVRRVGLYHNAGVTDAALRHLGNLTDLVVLDLRGTDVTDDGLVHLTGITNLEGLALNDTNVTDRGLDTLAKFTSLKHLGLEGTSISDEGLVQLRSLTNLESLLLNHCSGVSYSGATRLRELMPKCHIYR